MTDSERPRYGTGPKGLRRNRPRRSREEIDAEKIWVSPRRRKNPISWPLRALRFSPQLSKERQLLVPSLSTLKRPLGMAFEYLVRAQLQRINPNAQTGQWLAEEAIEVAKNNLKQLGYIYAEVDYFYEGLSGRPERATSRSKNPRKLLAQLDRLVDLTKTLEFNFVKSGLLNRDLVEGYVKLARLHGRFVGQGTFVAPYELDQVDPRAVHEMEAMFDLVDWSKFKAKKRCLLRPQFRSSFGLGRFEPDLVVDDTIIDLKAIESRWLDRRDIDQLFGYFALAELEGFKGRRKGGINKLALYFSRFADWLVIDLRNDYPEEKIEKYLALHRKRHARKAN